MQVKTSQENKLINIILCVTLTYFSYRNMNTIPVYLCTCLPSNLQRFVEVIPIVWTTGNHLLFIIIYYVVLKKTHHPHPATYNNSNDSNSHKVSQQLQMLFLNIKHYLFFSLHSGQENWNWSSLCGKRSSVSLHIFHTWLLVHFIFLKAFFVSRITGLFRLPIQIF